MLNHQARLHYDQGAFGLSELFKNAANEIDYLTEQNKELESFYALANELVEDYADFCSDTGALLPIEDQDSQVVVKAIQLLNKESK